MNLMFVIAGVLIFLSVVSNLVTGQIRSKRGSVRQSASPALFWLVIALKGTVVLVMLFPKQSLSLVQFGIEDRSAETRRKVEEFRQKQKPDSQAAEAPE